MSKEKEQKLEEEVTEEETKSEDKKHKFKYECIRCGACCQDRERIPITFSDLARWTKQGSFMSIILPHLELGSISEEDDIAKIALVPYIKMKDEDDNGKGTCPFYDPENKMCNIYFTLPIFCKTFPLSYNGEKFYISDPSCPGIGQGKMTTEKLTIMRQNAMMDFNQRADTTIAMIPLQGMFIRHFMKQSQESMDNLSPDDQAKLDDLIKKSQPDEKAKEEAKEESEKSE
ncbi:MAG: YkgJ family cysteine cluster protein [Candidatus Heimdallarchaeota archaeon]